LGARACKNMKNKYILITVVVVVFGGISGYVYFKPAQTADKPAPEKAAMPASHPSVTNAEHSPIAPEKTEASTEVSVEAALPPAKPKNHHKAVKTADTNQAPSGLVINGYEVQDPAARIALSFVGSDPDANSYWASAINDASLPAEERKDLIEDLNEDGLSDPHHPTAEDMPLIMARIQLIEQLELKPIDDVNGAAFAEAHKDLVGLLNGQEPQ
jgi:hypothetical protein